jgi:vitamin B12 transporter
MRLKIIILLFLQLLCHNLVAQTDTITLHQVVISDTQLRDYSNTQSVQNLNDSVITRNAPLLTGLLQYSTNLFFRENGPGMVSSPSFRGTSAQQTAVIWNGININSQFNGQTDFNTLNARDFSTISVRAGGGSVIYGSSAIGGSIHLDSPLEFGQRFDNEFRADYGSFNTYAAHYKMQVAVDTLSASISISHNSSDNDFEYPGYGVRNDNGQYHNTSLNAAFAYKLDKRNMLRLYGYVFGGQRHFSRTLAAPSRSMYDDFNTRTLVEWTGNYNRFTSRLKAAYLEENYKYFDNYASDLYTHGKVQTFIGRYDAAYSIANGMKVNAIADYTQNKGDGSDIVNKTRDIVSGSVLFSHRVSSVFQYEAGIRKEITSAYESPVLFSGGVNVRVSNVYSIKVNGSRNFRMPTFNDLYWPGSGNPNLNPETSYQAELGHVFAFGGLSATVTGYYIRLQDMLRWVPDSNGLWRPENVDRAKNYGAEAVVSWQRQFGSHTMAFTGTYAYTISRRDGSTNQLMYVPENKATAGLSYAYENFSAYYRHLFTGEVFYTTDNNNPLEPYNVSGIGAEYTFGFCKGLSLGAQVNNLYEEHYMAVAVRPMPGRNYNLYVNLKF